MDRFEQLAFMKEHFDYSDAGTIAVLKEADGQDKMIMALTSKLYDKIQEKYEKVDFSTVSRSRGDITKIEKYESLKECVEIIQQLVKEYREDTYPIDIVSTAIENLKERISLFKKAFNINSGIGIITYNTMALAIVESVSFLISTCIEYVKTPNNDTFRMALDTVAYNNTRQNLLFESLESFNASCKSGELDEALELAFKNTISKVHREASEIKVHNDNPFLDPEDEESDDSEVVVHDDKEDISEVVRLKEYYNDFATISSFEDEWEWNFGNVVSFGGRVFFFFAKALIPLIRNLVYFYYYHRQKKADYYEDLAQAIQMNMLQLQNNNEIDMARKKKILEKQQKYYDKYMKKRNKYTIDFNVSRKSTEKLIKDENKKFTAKNLGVEEPTSTPAPTSTTSSDSEGSMLF